MNYSLTFVRMFANARVFKTTWKKNNRQRKSYVAVYGIKYLLFSLFFLLKRNERLCLTLYFNPYTKK